MTYLTPVQYGWEDIHGWLLYFNVFSLSSLKGNVCVENENNNHY